MTYVGWDAWAMPALGPTSFCASRFLSTGTHDAPVAVCDYGAATQQNDKQGEGHAKDNEGNDGRNYHGFKGLRVEIRRTGMRPSIYFCHPAVRITSTMKIQWRKWRNRSERATLRQMLRDIQPQRPALR